VHEFTGAFHHSLFSWCKVAPFLSRGFIHHYHLQAQTRCIIRGAPLKMAKNICSPIITKLSGLVDIGQFRMYTKFEKKMNRSLLFSSVTTKNLVCWWKLLVRESSIKISSCQIMLRHALAFKYYLIMSKKALLKFGKVKSIKTVPFIAKLTWAVLLTFVSICLGFIGNLTRLV
jgi:hypothetical protein